MASALADNVRRLMAREGLTQARLADRAGLHVQTVKQVLAGREMRPHARTLYKLAAGLGVTPDELFWSGGSGMHESQRHEERWHFDRATNPVVDEVLSDHPRLCADWTRGDFEALYSRFGAGGALTYEGTLATIERINRARAIQERAAVLLETEYGELLGEFVDMLYRKVAWSEPSESQCGA